MIVLKFGGTSVGDSARVRAAAEVALLQPAPRVVIVSAATGITNALLDAARAAARGDLAKRTASVAHIHERHAEILAGVASNEHRQAAGDEVERLHAALDAALDEVAAAGELSDQHSDRIVSTGEKCLATLMSATINDMGHSATPVFADSVIATDGRHGSARPDRTVTRQRADKVMRPLLDAGRTLVVTGFIGFGPDGATTTLGRGGSDYSATLLGAALDADEVQIWTDVPGVLSADPRKVPSARVVPELGFDEAQELAHFGAKVLHPRTIRPAVARNIPVRILSTFAPDEPGTVVKQESTGTRVKAVTALRGLTALTLDVSELEDLAPAASAVFRIMDERHVEIVSVSQSSSRRRMTFLVDAVMGGCAQLQHRIEEDLENRVEMHVSCSDQVAAVAAVGAGAAGEPTSLSIMLSTLHRAGVAVLSTTQQTSNVAMLVVIPDDDADRAVAALHDRMVRPQHATHRSRRRRSALMAESLRVG